MARDILNPHGHLLNLLSVLTPAPDAAQSPIEPLEKGAWGGICNRTTCVTQEPALWFNRSTQAYYCETCARLINKHNPEGTLGYGMQGSTDPRYSFQPGEPLCILIETMAL